MITFRIWLASSRVSIDEAYDLTGTRPVIGEGGSVWSFKGDGNMTPNLVPLLIEAIEKNGGRVVEGFVESVYCDKDKGNVTALKVKNGDKEEIIKTSNIFTSFGARAEYNISDEVTNYKKPESIISGTGYSAYLIVEDNITRPIDSNNTHFTPLAHGKNKDGKTITLVKSTCGGAIGTDSFCVDHAINSLHYATNIIFPDAKVDIISAKSCSRPLNGQNSVQLTEIVPGFHTATGWGGKELTYASGFVLTHVAELLRPDPVDVFLKSFGTEKDKKPSHNTTRYPSNLKTPKVESCFPVKDEYSTNTAETFISDTEDELSINSNEIYYSDKNKGFVANLKIDRPPPEQNRLYRR